MSMKISDKDLLFFAWELSGQRAQQEAKEQLLKEAGDRLEPIKQMHKNNNQAKEAAQVLSNFVSEVQDVDFQTPSENTLIAGTFPGEIPSIANPPHLVVFFWSGPSKQRWGTFWTLDVWHTIQSVPLLQKCPQAGNYMVTIWRCS